MAPTLPLHIPVYPGPSLAIDAWFCELPVLVARPGMPSRVSSVSPQVGLPLTCALMPSTAVSTKCPRPGQNGSRPTGIDRINAHDI